MELRQLMRLSSAFLVSFITFHVLGFNFFQFIWLILYSIPLFLLGFVYAAWIYGSAYLQKHRFPLLVFNAAEFFKHLFWNLDVSTRFQPSRLDRRLTGCNQVDEQLQELLQLIFRDYIFSWYSFYFPKDAEFPHLLRSESVLAAIPLAALNI
jgi:hypothetical protein